MSHAAILLLWACSALLAAAEVHAVSTVPVIADLVRQVGGGRVAVASIVPAGVDLHTWQPVPGDAQRLAGAALVVANGLGMEPWLPGMIGAAGYRGPVVEAAAGLAARSDGHEVDPHAFHDIRNAQAYVRTIRDALVAADAAGAGEYRSRADLVLAELAVLDGWVRRQVAVIPAGRRLLVAPHDGLGYYAAAYGFDLRPVEGLGGGQEGDPRHVDALAAELRRRGVRTVFSEDGQGGGTLAALARSAGAEVSPPLATCGPAAGQGFRDMIVANTLAITAALRGP